MPAESELPPIGTAIRADRDVIWLLMASSVVLAAVTACIWFVVPIVSAFALDRAICSEASEIEELATADKALLRSADMRADSVEVCEVAVPD